MLSGCRRIRLEDWPTDGVHLLLPSVFDHSAHQITVSDTRPSNKPSSHPDVPHVALIVIKVSQSLP